MQEPFAAVVIGVGNELLNGRIANTNAQWLCGEIYSLGGNVRRVVTVPDDLDEIEGAVRESLAGSATWIVTTGGLGPTYDDMTLAGVAAALGTRLAEDGRAKEMIQRKLEEYLAVRRADSLEYTPERAKMATIPEGSIPLSNSVGTAPGVLAEVNGKFVACLPGVPSEMKAIFQEHLAPRMAAGRLETVTVETEVKGLPEASLAPILASLAKEYPDVYVKSHPRGFEGVSRVLVQLTGRGKAGLGDVESARRKLAAALDGLKADYGMTTKHDTQ
ncbi:MAG TPA: molybdopterin-binding protein [Conexivisphaerales archaeon]|nr:molybdopterin-binding protein [Conexivisphaerales archaeon]